MVCAKLKNDHIITGSVVLFTSLIVFMITRESFLSIASHQPYLAGFVKFFVLASIGDVVGLRLMSSKWGVPKKLLFKAIIWGLIGIVIVMMFEVFTAGVRQLQSNGLLPFEQSKFAFAFFVSMLMNLTFAPTMMLFHRVTDTYLNERTSDNKLTIFDAIAHIDLSQFIRVVVFKTIPFFWIPAHTITFLLPEEYRVIFAAILGILLGLILGMTKQKKGDTNE